MSSLWVPDNHFLDEDTAEATRGSPRHLETMPHHWHPLPLTPSTKNALMDNFSHYENFSYDEGKGGFLVEVPVPPGRAGIPRASLAILRDHVEVEMKLTRAGHCATKQPKRPLEECYSWWLGQLIHYGLRLELSTDEAKQIVKNAIVEGALKVPRHLKEMEQSMRNAANRRAKRKLRSAAGRSTSNRHRNNIKIESVTSDPETDSGVPPSPSSRRSVQSRAKIERDTSSERDAAREHDSSDLDIDSGTIEEIQLPNPVTSIIRNIARNKSASVEAQITQARKALTSAPKTIPQSSSESESDDEKGDISHRLVNFEQYQRSLEDDSDFDDAESVKTTAATAQPAREDSDGDKPEAGSVSGESDCKRAVIADSPANDGANARYRATDTNSSFESSSDDDIEFAPAVQPSLERNHREERATKHAPTTSTSDTTSKFALSKLAGPKEPHIERKRQPRPKELDSAATRDTTPSRVPKKQLDRDNLCTSKTARQPMATVSVHPEEMYDDVHDERVLRKNARMHSMFPKETIRFCDTCLVKHNGDCDDACVELVGSTTVQAPKKPTPKIIENAHATISTRKRKRSSSQKAATRQNSSLSKPQDSFTNSDSNEQIVNQDPGSERRRFLGLKKGVPVISDDINGSQIDLTISDDAESPDEIESRPMPKKRSRKPVRRKQHPSTADKPGPKEKRAVSIEIIPSPAAKAHAKQGLGPQNTFSLSPQVGSGLRGVLKLSPSTRPRGSLLNRALDSAEPPSSRSQDLPPYTRTKKPEPDVPAQSSLKKSELRAGPQYRVRSNSFTTESGRQGLKPKSNSKMRTSGQIEQVAQPETRQTLFPPEKSRIVGLSRQDGGGLLQRGIERKSSTGKSTSTKKHKQTAF